MEQRSPVACVAGTTGWSSRCYWARKPSLQPASLSLSRVLFDRLLPKSCMKQSGNTTYHLFPRMFNNQHGYLRSSFRCAAAPFRRRKAFQDLKIVTGNSCLEHLNPCFILYIYRWYDNRCFIRFFINLHILSSFSTSIVTIKDPLGTGWSALKNKG
jgi:hypothetical protein